MSERATVPGPPTSWRQEVAALVAETRRRLGGRDVARAAAALTYFGGIAVVPWLLLATWSQTWFAGVDDGRRELLSLAALVPPEMGARGPYAELVRAGTGLGVVGALVTLFPATFWGEGVRRACLGLLPQRDRLTGWRARAWLLPLVVVVPALTWVVVEVARATLLDLADRPGLGADVARVVVGFTLVWLALSVVLVWVFRHVAPRSTSWPAAALGALGTGSFLAGFLHGFQLFLAIPVDVGLPFGGLGVVGGVVAVGLWLYLLHVVLLVGWVVTTALDHRLRAAHLRRVLGETEGEA